jgi:hypothetical protein
LIKRKAADYNANTTLTSTEKKQRITRSYGEHGRIEQERARSYEAGRSSSNAICVEDDEELEPVKLEASGQESNMSSSGEFTTNDYRWGIRDMTYEPPKTRPRRGAEMKSNGTPDVAPPGPRQKDMDRRRDTELQQGPSEQQIGSGPRDTALATPQTAVSTIDRDNLETDAHVNRRANSEKPVQVKNGVGTEQEIAPLNALESITPAPSANGDSRQTTAAPRSIRPSGALWEAMNNLEREHETGTTTAKEHSDNPPIDPLIIAGVMRDRIAIKQLNLDIQQIQFDLEYEVEDQVKQQRRLDMARSKLEILQMQYELQHGEKYSG